MDFSSHEHTKYVWEQIEEIWKDRHKPEGERFLGNNRFSVGSVESLLTALAENLSKIDSLSIDKLNAKWGDRQNRNWVKIITFVLSEYAYFNETKSVFWENLSQRLKINDPQVTKQTFGKVLKEGFNLLGVAKSKGVSKYLLSTLYLQSSIPKQNLKYFVELMEDVADNLGWWNIAHRYEAIDLAQTLYDRVAEKHPERVILKRFLKISCQDDKPNPSYVEPIAGNLLKYIATIALELERRRLNPRDFADIQMREKHLQSFSLPYNFFLRDWGNLVSILTPKIGSQGQNNRSIRQSKRELLLRLDTLALNLQLVLPEQHLWRKEWQNLSNNYCQIPHTQWESKILYPNSLEIPEFFVNLTELRDHWTWNLQDVNQQTLLEWHGNGVTVDFPLLVFDAETGDRLTLSSHEPQITDISEIVCYFPKGANLQLNDEIEVTDACLPCLISDWQAQQIQLMGRSASFSLVNESLHITVQWQSASSNQPTLRGLQIKGKQPTYLEAPQIYCPFSNSGESLYIQIENIDRQATVTPPDTTITAPVAEVDWQQISLSQWIQTDGNYAVKLWRGNWHWSASFVIKKSYQAFPNPHFSQVQIQNSQQENVFVALPIRCTDHHHFWTEELKIQGLWAFEPIAFILSGDEGKPTFSYSLQADQTGSLNLSLISLREALPDSDRYVLDWLRFGSYQRLIEAVIA